MGIHKHFIASLFLLGILSGCGDSTDPSDTTPPVISMVQVSNITSTGATVGFTTDEPSAVQLDYADDSYYAGNTAYNQTESPSGYVTSHSVSLSNLSPSTTYHYRMRVKDAADNVTTSADRTFTTQAQDTAAPVLSNPTPVPSSILAAGTTSTTLGITTNEAAQCRYATAANTAYASMPNSFTTTGSTTHSTTLTGLVDGGAYSYYIRCQDGSGNASASDYTVTFSVATGGGGNQPPVLAFIVDIVVTEGETVTFSPSATDADGDNLSFSYSGWMTSSSYTTQTGDAGAHTVTVTVDDGNGGTDSQVVTVTVNTPALDSVPPVRSAGGPSGTLPTGTTSATLSLATDENATCRYAATANIAYASMGNTFSTTGSMAHSTLVSGLSDGNFYTYYAKCQDTAGNANLNDYPIAFSVASSSGGGTPSWVDQNSPLALNLHPRLYLIPDSYKASNPNAYGMTVSEMRQKLVMYYKAEFQAFINTMDGVYNDSVASKQRLNLTYDAMNYAFLYMIDPSDSIMAANFSFTHAKNDYGNKAIAHALQIATNVTNTSWNSSGGWNDHEYMRDTNQPDRNGMVNLSLALVYDWLNNVLLLNEKQQIADAVIDLYEKRVLMRYVTNISSGQTGILHNGDLGALAIWGDALDGTGTYYSGKLQTILDAVNSDWIEGVYNFTNNIFKGSFHQQGPGYNGVAFINASWVTEAISTTLNKNYFNDSLYFREYPQYLLFCIKPFPYNGNYRNCKYGTVSRDTYVGTNPDRLRQYATLIGPLLKDAPDMSSINRWLLKSSGKMGTTSFGVNEARYYSLFYQFFWGDESQIVTTPAQTGIPLSAKLGFGWYGLRTGFDSDNDTSIMFNAQQYHFEDGGHGRRGFATFYIDKYGPLALNGDKSKTFIGGNIGQTNSPPFFNTVGIYKPGESYRGNNVAQFRTGMDDNAIYHTDPAFQDGGANHIGDVIAEDLNGVDYDYVNYDYTKAHWNSQTTSDTTLWKADHAQRELVYLRPENGAVTSDKEYVVVYDRVSTTDPSYTKRWYLQTAFDPGSPDGTWAVYPGRSGTDPGKWTLNNSKIISVTNNFQNMHGRLFIKPLSPSSLEINKVGGPGHHVEDAEGNVIWGGTMPDEEKMIFAGFRIELEPTSNQKDDQFLVVMQIGDSNTLTSMTPTTKIDAGNMVGTLINDTTTPRVVLFSSDPHGAAVSNVTYSVGTLLPASSKHLLLGMQSGTYDVYRDGVLIYPGLAVSTNGVLAFDSAGGSSYQLAIQ